MIAFDGNLQDLVAKMSQSDWSGPLMIIIELLPQLDEQELLHLQKIEIPAVLRAERKKVPT